MGPQTTTGISRAHMPQGAAAVMPLLILLLLGAASAATGQTGLQQGRQLLRHSTPARNYSEGSSKVTSFVRRDGAQVRATAHARQSGTWAGRLKTVLDH